MPYLCKCKRVYEHPEERLICTTCAEIESLCLKLNTLLLDRTTVALLAWGKEQRNETLEEATKRLQELRDSPMLIGKDAWEVGRIAGLDSAVRVIRRMKEECQ